MDEKPAAGRLLRLLLVGHGVVTLAAAVMLAVAPGAIPATVGIDLDPSDTLLSFLLAGAELGIAVVSIAASRFRERPALSAVVAAFIAFHLGTAILEIVHLATIGWNLPLALNVGVRALVATALAIGLRMSPKP